MRQLVLLIGTVPLIGLFACGDENAQSPGITGAKTQESACVVVKDEGCTPGYWKQKHHFDSWPDGVHPVAPDGGEATLVEDAFGECGLKSCDDAICKMTLLEVLKQGGGGLSALGRHAVAAYLNALNHDVAYPMSEDEVRCLFLDALDNRSVVESNKDELEESNELGCPLN